MADWFERIPIEFYVFCAGLFGACWGSFFHVCVVRIPYEQSIVSPGSRCPQCKNPIAWFDNIPILSYLQLGGACRYCQKTIPARYMIMELLTAILFMGIVMKFGVTSATLVYLALVSNLIIISGIDWDHFYIPDELNIPLTPIALVLAAIAQYTGWFPDLMVTTFWDALIGFVVGGGVIWSIRALGTLAYGQEAMGFGDVKLMMYLGAFLGAGNALLCIFIAAFIGSIVGLSLKYSGNIEKYGHLPFGPYLALGAYCCLLFGPEILDWYLEPFRV